MMLVLLVVETGARTWAEEAVREDGPCPSSIEEIDFLAFLDERDELEPEDCLWQVTEPPTVELTSVEYAELDGEPGLEAVVRAQTCVMGSGGPDISEVFKLSCDGEEGWLLRSIPIEPVPYELGPGRRRYAPFLEVTSDRLISISNLYRPENPTTDPSWELVAQYYFDGSQFWIESTSLHVLEKPSSP